MVVEINRVHPFVVYSANIVSLFSCFAMFGKKQKQKNVVVAVLLHFICTTTFYLCDTFLFEVLYTTSS